MSAVQHGFTARTKSAVPLACSLDFAACVACIVCIASACWLAFPRLRGNWRREPAAALRIIGCRYVQKRHLRPFAAEDSLDLEAAVVARGYPLLGSVGDDADGAVGDPSDCDDVSSGGTRRLSEQFHRLRKR